MNHHIFEIGLLTFEENVVKFKVFLFLFHVKSYLTMDEIKKITVLRKTHLKFQVRLIETIKYQVSLNQRREIK